MSIVRIVKKAQMHLLDEKTADLHYWMSVSPLNRLQAVTFLISQTLDLNVHRMDKSIVVKRNLKV